MNRHSESHLALAIVALALCAPTAWADWPLIRGDASACGYSADPVGDDIDQLWTFRAEDSGFESAAAIVDGVVYIGDVDGTFYALRLDDGSVVWKRKYRDEVRVTGDGKALFRPDAIDTGFLNGVAVAGGRIFATDYNGIVRCLDAVNGDVLWSMNTDSELYAAPNIHEGRVLLVTESGELLSIEADSGDVRWKFSIDQPLRCWPTVVDGRALVAGCDAQLHVIDVKTGEKAQESIQISGPPDAMPAVLDGRVYFCTAGGVFHVMTINPLAEQWSFAHPGQGEELHGAAVTDQLVILGAHNKQVVALDRLTGDQRWTFPTPSRVESSPVVAGDLALFGTIRGRFYAVEAATGEEVWQFQAGGRFIASPAVSEGRVVLGNEDGTLYCFGGQSED